MLHKEDVMRNDTHDAAAKLDEVAAQMTQFEQALTVTKNAFEQWVLRCAAGAGISGFSALELHVLAKTVNTERPRRIADICFSMKIEDTHLVTYALKKLLKAGLVESARTGKETFFSCTDEGRRTMHVYKEVRRKYLIKSVSMFSENELDIERFTDMLHALSGMYEQAARTVDTVL
jgi:predicted MarR family transcription regulator